MRPSGLIDTGAILALLDRDDRWHERCRAASASLRFALATSAAVLAELFHLVGDQPGEVDAARGFLRSGAVSVLPIDDSDLPALENLTGRYADHPMDFADAKNVDQIVACARSGFVPLVSGVPGFATYAILDAGKGGLVTLSGFTNQAGVAESTKAVAGFVSEQLASLVPKPPDITSGEVRLRVVGAKAR